MRPNNKGMTLLEIIVVVAIGAVVAAATTAFLVTGSRMSTAVMSQNRFDTVTRARIETLKNEVREGRSFTVLNSGTRLEIATYDDTTVVYEYRDADEDPATLLDNAIFREVAGTEQSSRILSHVDSGPGPVFVHPGGAAPLTIRLRVGDPVDDQRPYVTGPGTQAVDVVTTVTARNS